MPAFQFFLEDPVASLLRMLNVFVKLFHYRLRNSLVRSAKLPSSCVLVKILEQLSNYRCRVE